MAENPLPWNQPQPERDAKPQPTARPGRKVLAPAPAAKPASAAASPLVIVAVAAAVGLTAGFFSLAGKKGQAAAPPSAPTGVVAIPSGASVVAPVADEAQFVQDMRGGQVGRPASTLPGSPKPIAGEEIAGLDESSSESFSAPPKELDSKSEGDLVPYDPNPRSAHGEMGGAETGRKSFAPPRLQAMGNVSGYLEGGAQTSAYMSAGAAPARRAAGGGETDQVRALLQAVQEAQGQAQANQRDTRRAGRRSRASGAQGAAVPFAGVTTPGTRTTAAAPAGAEAAGQARRGQMGVAGVLRLAPQATAGDLDSVIRRFVPGSGRHVLVFAAPWCPYSYRAAPATNEMRGQLQGRGVGMTVVVGQDTDRAKLQDLAGHFTGRVLIDETNANVLRNVPAYVLVENGRALAIHRGTFGSAAQGIAWANR
jgi:hypothetical protein